MKNINKTRKKSIESDKTLEEKTFDFLLEVCGFILLFIFLYAVVHFIPNIAIQYFLKWYIGIFFLALFPVIFSWIVEKNKVVSFWEYCLLVFVVLLNIVGYIIDTERIDLITQYRVILDLFITVFVIVFFVSLLKVRKGSNRYRSKKLSSKKIRRDLYYRTPGLIVDISNIELIKYCEKYFYRYILRYRKIKKIRTIEYVNLMGIYRELWYARVARFMKAFVGISFFITALSIFFGNLFKLFVVIGLIIIFGVLTKIYKHIDKDCLCKIAIRYAYDEWGYYLTWENGDKYIGTVQILDMTKYHKYVYSFLDIVALCRAVAYNDQMNSENRISIISRNLSDLFINYTEYEEEESWEMFLPLWQAALFEFSVTGRIGEEAKVALNKVSDNEGRVDISIFLQSFWANIESKEIKDGISGFIQLFEKELFA